MVGLRWGNFCFWGSVTAEAGGGVLWNLLLGVRGLRDNPSVKPAACQLSTRHALRVPFQGSLKKASPERGDSPRGGEMPAGQRGPLSTRGTSEAGGGILLWNFTHEEKNSHPINHSQRLSQKPLRFCRYIRQCRTKSVWRLCTVLP